MKNTKDIYRAVEYIENNLKSNLSVEKIANHVSYSLYYFSRVFSKTTGHSPYDYIMRRRLSMAAAKLINNEQKIIDIAFDYQFQNPETFTRAFTKMFNHLPSHIKTKSDLNKLILKQAITKDYLNYINNCIFNIKTEIINKNDMYLIGLVINDQISNKIQKKIIDDLNTSNKSADNYIIYFNPINYYHKQTKLLAYESNSLENTPSIYVGKKIPAQKYSKFVVTVNHFNMEYIFQYLYQTILKFTQIKVNAPYAIEHICRKENTSDKVSKILYIPLD